MTRLTRMSSKGQIVIPRDVRKGMKIEEGTYFAIVAKKNMLVLKKLDTKIKPDDLKTLRLLEEAYEDLEKGRYKIASIDDFLKEMSKWKK